MIHQSAPAAEAFCPPPARTGDVAVVFVSTEESLATLIKMAMDEADLFDDAEQNASPEVPDDSPLAELRQVLAQWRVLLVRTGEAGISYATLRSIAAAVLIHIIILGSLFLVGAFAWATWQRHDPFARSAGGAGGMFIAQSDFAGANAATVPPAPAAMFRHAASRAPDAAIPSVTPAPALLQPVAAPRLLNVSPRQASLPMIAMAPSLADFSTPPARVDTGAALKGHAPRSSVATLTIAPPGPAPASAPAHAPTPDMDAVVNPGGKSNTSLLLDADSDDTTYHLFKPGSGRGQGESRGNGIDRGPSGANNPNPVLLNFSRVDLPVAMQWMALSGQKIVLDVTVLPDGTAGEIKIRHSSGYPQLDALYVAQMKRTGVFRPAYRNGQPIRSVYPISFSIGADLN